jgi:acyl-[acyl-carrier-protein] desaturase
VIYETHLKAAEDGAWPLDSTIAWTSIDRSIASGEQDIHRALRDASLIEGYLPVYAARLMHLAWDDVDATAVLSLELYEGLRHYTALKRYLDLVGYQTASDADAALARARERTLSVQYKAADLIEHFTHFMASELFAAYFFLRLSRQSREPVLCDLLSRMSRDEFRHSAAAGAVIEQRVRRDPDLVPRVLRAAESFRHYGSDIVDVPVAEANDFEAIVALNRRVRMVCGIAPTDHLKGAMEPHDEKV